MLLLSNEIKKQLDLTSPKKEISVTAGNIRLYLSKEADALLEGGFLNFVLSDELGQLLGYPLKEMQSFKLKVKYQENIEQPNVSAIMYIWLDKGRLHAQHWDGYISVFDVENFRLLSQKFVK